jgi:transcriptional antiterminator RfaH
VIHTKPRQEKALAWDLKVAGIGYYLPLSVQKKRSANRLRISELPLFTSYLFMNGNGFERLVAYKTNRVVRVIEVTDQDSLRCELASVHKALASNRLLVASANVFPKGKRVRISEGPLEGVEGVILQSKNSRELVIQVASIHRSLRVAIEFDKVEPFSA